MAITVNQKPYVGGTGVYVDPQSTQFVVNLTGNPFGYAYQSDLSSIAISGNAILIKQTDDLNSGVSSQRIGFANTFSLAPTNIVASIYVPDGFNTPVFSIYNIDASGFDINFTSNIDSTGYKIMSQVISGSGAIGNFTSYNVVGFSTSGVSTLNSLTSAVNITGAGSNTVTVNGQTITISGSATPVDLNGYITTGQADLRYYPLNSNPSGYITGIAPKLEFLVGSGYIPTGIDTVNFGFGYTFSSIPKVIGNMHGSISDAILGYQIYNISVTGFFLGLTDLTDTGSNYRFEYIATTGYGVYNL